MTTGQIILLVAVLAIAAPVWTGPLFSVLVYAAGLCVMTGIGIFEAWRWVVVRVRRWFR